MDDPEPPRPRWRRGIFRGAPSLGASHAAEWSSRHWTSRTLHRVGEVVAHSTAGVAAAAVMLVWAVVGAAVGFSSWWQTVLYSVTSSVTFVMVFVIQHTQARQTSAIQRKLDELLRSTVRADASLIAVEEAPDEQLQAFVDRDVAEREQVVLHNDEP
ncbi:MAG: hypothetical protein JWL70_2961 [Acidimicrobiia bacterium]|nr:hypothetical protein [Acidimicrobiia bacterium]